MARSVSSTKDVEMTLQMETDKSDAALRILEGQTIPLTEDLTPEEDRRILRRIDICILPALFVTFLLQYVDKSAMGYTAILGLRTDLHLVGQDYSWASSLFYFGYLTASGLVAILLVRLPVGRFMSIAIVIWAAILMLTSLCTNASGLWAGRFCLGFVEAAIAPGMSMIISMWYKRSEQTLRQSVWFMGNVTGGLCGGLLGYGIGHINSIAPWKALFLIFGGLTLVWAIFGWFLIPNSPVGAWFLEEEDQYKAIERVKDNLTGIKNSHIKLDQVLEAFKDPKVWLLAAIQLTQNVPNGALGSFSSIVINGFGFSTLDTLLLQMVGFGFQGLFCIISAIGCTYLTNTRTYFMAFNTVMSLIGTIMIRQIDHKYIWGRFMGYCLTIVFSVNFPLLLATITSNIAGFSKKVTTTAIVFIAYCTGNIIGPQIMFSREAPSYPSGFAGILVCFSCSTILIFVLRFYLIWENKKRDAASQTIQIDEERISTSALNLLDKTDRDLPQFRYVY
ncbi:hypothetical protein VE03_03041 [Pseudogymnoascus sp. 23342-1-I1]|nr:hypothetical protein VE03_03041 [Pseudogymnoascus sp. 23342-1-I1]